MTQNKKSNQEIKITCESFVPGSLANPSVEVAVPGSLAFDSKFESVSSVFSLLVFHLSHLLFFLQTKTNVQERGVKENEMIQCSLLACLRSKFVSVSSVVVFKQR